MFFFLSSKGAGGHAIFRRNEQGACNEKFRLSYNILLPRRADTCDSLPSPPKSVRKDGVRWRHDRIFSDGQITKFSSHGALQLRALRARELRYYLTHMINVWGCMEILPTHSGVESVKVNYYRCMSKIWGLVKPHKVNKLQMILPCYRIYSNGKTQISLHKYSFTSKNQF